MDPIQNQPPVAGEKKSFGAIAGIVIIIILLVLGAFYVWGGKLSTQDDARSSSDEISSVETDTEIDLSGLDAIE